MKFPVALHSDDGIHFGVTIPDLPGCFSAGSDEDQALENAREAIIAHLELLAEEGGDIPSAGTVAQHRTDPELRDAIWGFVEVDITPFLGKAEKINITVPRLVLHQIDQYLRQHPEVAPSRSRFLTEAALQRVKGGPTPSSEGEKEPA